MNERRNDRGERIARAIEITKAGKLSALALQIGVNESAICRWKKNGKITLDNACVLCETLDVSMDWLALGRGTCFQHRKKINVTHDHVESKELRRLSEDSVDRLSDFIKSVLTESST